MNNLTYYRAKWHYVTKPSIKKYVVSKSPYLVARERDKRNFMAELAVSRRAGEPRVINPTALRNRKRRVFLQNSIFTRRLYRAEMNRQLRLFDDTAPDNDLSGLGKYIGSSSIMGLLGFVISIMVVVAIISITVTGRNLLSFESLLEYFDTVPSIDLSKFYNTLSGWSNTIIDSTANIPIIKLFGEFAAGFVNMISFSGFLIQGFAQIISIIVWVLKLLLGY